MNFLSCHSFLLEWGGEEGARMIDDRWRMKCGWKCGSEDNWRRVRNGGTPSASIESRVVSFRSSFWFFSVVWRHLLGWSVDTCVSSFMKPLPAPQILVLGKALVLFRARPPPIRELLEFFWTDTAHSRRCDLGYTSQWVYPNVSVRGQELEQEHKKGAAAVVWTRSRLVSMLNGSENSEQFLPAIQYNTKPSLEVFGDHNAQLCSGKRLPESLCTIFYCGIRKSDLSSSITFLVAVMDKWPL